MTQTRKTLFITVVIILLVLLVLLAWAWPTGFTGEELLP